MQTVAVAFGLKQIFDQIEDGRDGGNIGFEDDDRNQYEDECRCRKFSYLRKLLISSFLDSHMMTKLKLNVYRAEDEFITMQRLQWRREEEENKKERKKVIMSEANIAERKIDREVALSVRLRLRRRWRR